MKDHTGEMISGSIDAVAEAIHEFGYGNGQRKGPMWTLGNDICMAGDAIADGLGRVAEAIEKLAEAVEGGKP